jgi:23S rRNA A2030 N6-methylase RlmJ
MLTYTHSAKIGNRGDLPKHIVLARLVLHLSQTQGSSDFVYAETHAGRPMYTLGQNGEWEEGIGQFHERLKDHGWKAKFPNLKPYAEYSLREVPRIGGEYPGSSGLVFLMLDQLGLTYRFFLCDADSAVCADLMSYFPQWEQVAVCRGDGFHLVGMLDSASLVMVDPAYMKTQDDKHAVLETLLRLDEKNVPVICWTPRIGPTTTPDGEAIYSIFEREVLTRFGAVPVKWGSPDAMRFWGCQITVSRHLETLTANTVQELNKIMGWMF